MGGHKARSFVATMVVYWLVSKGKWLTLGGCLMQVVTQTVEEGFWIRGLKEQLGIKVAGNKVKLAYSNDRKGGKSSIE